jgi:hypothetical protein
MSQLTLSRLSLHFPFDVLRHCSDPANGRFQFRFAAAEFLRPILDFVPFVDVYTLSVLRSGFGFIVGDMIASEDVD